MLALARGDALQFDVHRNGQRIGAISATVDRNRMIETVLSLGRRDRGEIPFVLDAEGDLHTVDPDAAATARDLGLDATARSALASASTQMAGDWLVVTRRDPSGSCLAWRARFATHCATCGRRRSGTSASDCCSSPERSPSSCRWRPG